MSITIDHDVPAPAVKLSAGRHTRYPFDGMKPGDSFSVALDGKTAAERGRYIKSAGINWAKRRGIRAEFVTAPCAKNAGHVRIWLQSREQASTSTTKQG